ncbi:MAG TPA: tetratricopeptide repeat protein [Acetobacteraceae bacterium]|nr:tetratricopeptide repeat protein [Acetobacteraceae bacterium]
MRRVPFGLLLLLAGAAPAAAPVEQATGGWCSPAVNGSNNQVVCNGVDPRAMARLNDQLDSMDLSLRQKTEEANEWARRYTELNAQFEETKRQLAAKGDDPALVQAAQDLLREGKLEEARKIYDRLIASDEGNVDRAAQDHFSRASIFALQFRVADAIPDYAKAYQYRPDNARYAGDYASALWRQRDYPKAEAVLRGLLPQARTLAAQDPAAHRPNLGRTLTILGLVYDDTHRFAEAEAALREAADIRRALAARSPAAYRPALAQTLNNLGNLYRDTHHFAEAEAAYTEAAGIQRELAAQNPAAYRPDLATMLTNLGNLYADTHRFAEAEAALKEAAGIRRELAAQNPAAYREDLQRTLSNLALLYRAMHRESDAKALEAEAM